MRLLFRSSRGRRESWMMPLSGGSTKPTSLDCLNTPISQTPNWPPAREQEKESSQVCPFRRYVVDRVKCERQEAAIRYTTTLLAAHRGVTFLDVPVTIIAGGGN